MKKSLILTCLMLTLAFFVGCGGVEEHKTSTVRVEGAAGQSTSMTTVTEPGTTASAQSAEPAWVNETRRAEGKSAMDTVRYPNFAQAKLMALRGAEIDARRQLLEAILGLRIDSKTIVKDMVAEYDRVDASTSGVIRNSYKIGESCGSDGICRVTVEIKLYDVWQHIRREVNKD